jgi:hypothetical protein
VGETVCEHESMFWYSAPANEQGWRCANCNFQPGEPPGYSPLHDRDLLHVKVWSILDDLHNHEIVYISNGSEGDVLVRDATTRCREERVVDQESIARVLLQIVAGDGKYWREKHEQFLAGNDPRDRCRCGALSTCTTWRDGVRITTCSKHPPAW